MEPRGFDDLARIAARPTSRRHILGAIAGGALALAMGRFPASAEGNLGNSRCAHFCAAVYPPGPNRGTCISAAAQGTGLCVTCDADLSRLCGDTCCDSGTTCMDGACQPICEAPSTCTGDTCGHDRVCINGGCFAPPVGGSCAGSCGSGDCQPALPFLSTDPNPYCADLSAPASVGCLVSEEGTGGCPAGYMCTISLSPDSEHLVGACVPGCGYPA